MADEVLHAAKPRPYFAIAHTPLVIALEFLCFSLEIPYSPSGQAMAQVLFDQYVAVGACTVKLAKHK